MAQWIETNVMSPYRNQKLQEGRSSTEQREWRMNLVTNYTFTEGKLKGFGAGSAVRWQDGAVIGYPTTLASDGVTLIADITKQCEQIHKALYSSYITYGAETVL